jgi:hypothetical protein
MSKQHNPMGSFGQAQVTLKYYWTRYDFDQTLFAFPFHMSIQ